MARGEPREPGSELPAPYRSPWRALGEALAAVLADGGLRLRELLRRNRQGDLPLPSFWPQAAAALFWPLLLAALLAAVIGLALLRPGRAQLPRQVGGDGAPQAGLQAPLETVGEGLAAAQGSGPGIAGGGTVGSSAVAVPGERSAGPRQGEIGPQPAAAPPLALGAPAGPPPLRLDPLLELVVAGEDGALLRAAHPDPSRSLLTLTLAEGAEALGPSRLLERAETWRQRAAAAGYERLELRDDQGHLRGRQALVGSGMILLAPAPDS